MSDSRRKSLAVVSEDNSQVRFTLITTLKELDFVTIATQTAETAWAMIRQQQRVDLLVTDIRLAGKLSGLDLAYRVATEMPETRVIITSGFPGGTFNSEQPKRYAYLSKPFSSAILARRVLALMKRKS